MSDAPDKDSKTEQATEKKIADAIEKGNTPFSREASVFASLAGILVILAFGIRQSSATLTDQLRIFLDNPGDFSLETGNDATMLLWAVSLAVGRFLVPAIAVLAVAGVASSLLQNVPNLVLERIRPKMSRISFSGGIKRVFGVSGQVEVLKSVFKFGAIAVTCLVLLRSDFHAVVNAMFSDPSLVPALVLSLAVRLVAVVCVATMVLVCADLVWAHFRWRTDLRMTRQEVKDELKQSEGDPLIKARLRSIARDRSRRRMISHVPRATVVIANPTHYAVALRYERDKGGAPQVVAKGADLIALRIREIAGQHMVPVVEDRPLARALYEAVDVDQFIPPEFYRAVAQILYYVYSGRKHVELAR